MRTSAFVMLLGAFILAVGCIPSLHPFYTEKDLVFEPSLIGQWATDNANETWIFSKRSTNEYKLVYTDNNGKQGSFGAHLIRIEGKLFLDFFPDKPVMEENDFYKSHLLMVHTFAYVNQIEPTLQMAFPNADWLKKHLAANPDSIGHEEIRGGIVLTAKPEQLQAFWLKHLDTKDTFGKSSNMKRIKNVVEETSNQAEADVGVNAT